MNVALQQIYISRFGLAAAQQLFTGSRFGLVVSMTPSGEVIFPPVPEALLSIPWLPLSDIQTGQLAIPLIPGQSIDTAFADSRNVLGPTSRSWMELWPLPLRDFSGQNWLALAPQNEDPAFESLLYAVVRSSDSRSVALPVVSVSDPAAPAAHQQECYPGFDGVDDDLHYVCIQGTCRKECRESWKSQRGRSRLVGCAC